MRPRHLTLSLLAIIVFHDLLLCQVKPVDSENWKRAGIGHQFAHNGMPLLFPSRANVFERSKLANLGVNDLFSNNRLQRTVSDSVLFEPVSGPYGGTVRSITLDSDGWLFLATDGEVYRSSDNGAHWDMSLFPSQLHNYVEPVTVLGPNIVVAETDFSNFISTDRGESWNYLYQDVQGFAVDTTGEIYAGSNYGGVKKSADTAKSWIPFALAGKKIWKVVLCGEGKFACPSDSGNYFSADTGKTWVFRPYETPFTWNLVSDRAGRLFVLRYYDTNFQLFRSTDFGVSWQRIILPDSDPYEDAYRIYVEKDHRVFVVTNRRIVTSIDGGDTWLSLVSPPGIMALTVGRDSEGNLLAGTFFGIYRRNEAYGQWEELNNGIRAGSIGQILFTSTGSIIVAGIGRWFRSSDDGRTWPQVYFDSTLGSIQSRMLSSSNGSLFVMSRLDGQNVLLRSDDDGLSWRRISPLSNNWAIRDITEGASGDILVGDSSGDVYRSTNEGQTWTKVVSSASHSEITSITTDRRGNYYAARRDSSVLVSKGGDGWNRVILERRFSSFESISIDAQGEVFLGSSSNGVYHSSDTGGSWNLLNSGLFDRYVMSTASDDSGNVLLGTASGVFRLTDSVDSWVRFSNGLPRTFTTALAVSPEGFLFAGFQNFGIYKTAAPLGRRIPRIEPPPPPPNIGIGDFRLHQNYPNPFNNQTVIRYEVPSFAKVEIRIHNVLGQVVSTLIASELTEGRYDVGWAPEQLASGVYFCHMKASSSSSTYQKTIKLLYLR